MTEAVCGDRPIAKPSEEQINAMHAQLFAETRRMYYRWRDAAGYGGIELEIV